MMMRSPTCCGTITVESRPLASPVTGKPAARLMNAPTPDQTTVTGVETAWKLVVPWASMRTTYCWVAAVGWLTGAVRTVLPLVEDEPPVSAATDPVVTSTMVRPQGVGHTS